MELPTPHGMVTVLSSGIPFDPQRLLREVDDGYARARRQVAAVDAISLDGLRIQMEPGPFENAVGQYLRGSDIIRVAAGVETVLDHELQHRFCYELGHDGPCCLYQDHAGGYGLDCSPL